MVLWTVQLSPASWRMIPKALCGLRCCFHGRRAALPFAAGLLRTAYYARSCLCALSGGIAAGRRWSSPPGHARRPLHPEGGEDSALRFFNRKLNGLKKMRGAAVVALGALLPRRGEPIPRGSFWSRPFILIRRPVRRGRWSWPVSG